MELEALYHELVTALRLAACDGANIHHGCMKRSGTYQGPDGSDNLKSASDNMKRGVQTSRQIHATLSSTNKYSRRHTFPALEVYIFC